MEREPVNVKIVKNGIASELFLNGVSLMALAVKVNFDHDEKRKNVTPYAGTVTVTCELIADNIEIVQADELNGQANVPERKPTFLEETSAEFCKALIANCEQSSKK